MYIIFLLSSLIALMNPASQQEDWIILFDGSSTEEWAAEGSDSFPRRGWTIDEDEGSMMCQGGGSLISKRTFADFELRLEFRINPRGNSGIFYRYNGDFYESPEYQILDDLQKHRKDVHSVGALYDLLAAGPKELRRAGNWNTARIVAAGNHVEHWLNGKKVLEYEIDSDQFKRILAGSKFRKHPNFAQQKSGHILLQDHGNVVSFRNIKIRELSQP